MTKYKNTSLSVSNEASAGSRNPRASSSRSEIPCHPVITAEESRRRWASLRSSMNDDAVVASKNGNAEPAADGSAEHPPTFDEVDTPLPETAPEHATEEMNGGSMVNKDHNSDFVPIELPPSSWLTQPELEARSEGILVHSSDDNQNALFGDPNPPETSQGGHIVDPKNREQSTANLVVSPGTTHLMFAPISQSFSNHDSSFTSDNCSKSSSVRDSQAQRGSQTASSPEESSVHGCVNPGIDSLRATAGGSYLDFSRRMIQRWEQTSLIQGDISENKETTVSANENKRKSFVVEQNQDPRLAVIVLWPQLSMISEYQLERMKNLPPFLSFAVANQTRIIYNLINTGSYNTIETENPFIQNAQRHPKPGYPSKCTILPGMYPQHLFATVVRNNKVGSLVEGKLAEILVEEGINTLILVGASTSTSILSTYVEACDMNFRVFVIKDLCGDANDLHHELVMSIMQQQAHVLESHHFANQGLFRPETLKDWLTEQAE